MLLFAASMTIASNFWTMSTGTKWAMLVSWIHRTRRVHNLVSATVWSLTSYGTVVHLASPASHSREDTLLHAGHCCTARISWTAWVDGRVAHFHRYCTL